MTRPFKWYQSSVTIIYLMRFWEFLDLFFQVSHFQQKVAQFHVHHFWMDQTIHIHYYSKGFFRRHNVVTNIRKLSLKKILRRHVVANMSSQIIGRKRVICDDMFSRNFIYNENCRKYVVQNLVPLTSQSSFCDDIFKLSS